jgi:hypothetical protein
VVPVDINESIGSVPYDMITDEDLAETIRLVEAAQSPASLHADARSTRATRRHGRPRCRPVRQDGLLIINDGICIYTASGRSPTISGTT